MPTVIATVGGATSNSYPTVAEADTFMDARTNTSAWTSASADDKARALIQATARIDLEEYDGSPVRPLTDRATGGPTQALLWPRIGARTPDGWTYASDVIPERIKRGTMLLALAILAGDFAPADSGLEGYELVKIDVLTVKPRKSDRATRLPDEVRRELRPLLRTPSGTNFRLVRG